MEIRIIGNAAIMCQDVKMDFLVNLPSGQYCCTKCNTKFYLWEVVSLDWHINGRCVI